MTPHLVWQGLAVGFLAAIPLGPMGMVCVQRTLARGRMAGLASACGLTLASAFWCVVAAQGLSRVTRLVAGHEMMLTVGLGLFLVAVGIWGMTRCGRTVEMGSGNDYGSLAAQFVSSLLGVILNPVTLVTMTAVLAVLGGVQARLGVEGMAGLAVAVFLGGMTLWLGITQGVAFMGARLGESGGERLGRILNGCILALGVVYLIRPLLSEVVG
jgi:threonine/homoserine/homoserine lactone efflux protein